jgi:uncharacterized protein YjbI with pentapeptide repeats
MSNLEAKAMRFLEDDPIDPDCIERSLGACKGEPFFGEHEGKRYCVLHFPDAAKNDAFEIAVQRKLESKDFNYQGVWFPNGGRFSGLDIDKPVDFSFAVFNDRASFYSTTFRAEVKFRSATFTEDASFGGAIFAEKVGFESATFRKKADFNQAKFEAYASFWRCTFAGPAEFRDTVFRQTASFWPTTFKSTASFYNASFVWGNFGSSKFEEKAVFSRCEFGVADFVGTSFSDDADFSSSKFDGMANFISATFDSALQLNMSAFVSEARFRMATFNGKADFSYTVFKGIVSFSAEHGIGGFGTNAACDFRHVRFESPRQVSFHGLTLRPHWFLILDPREFEFIDVKWIGQLRRRFIDIEIGNLRKREELERKQAANNRAKRLRELELFGDQVAVEELKEEEVEAARIEASELNQRDARFCRLLSLACRQLAVNAEENHRYDQGSDFRFWSMELQRKDGWKARGKIIGILHTLYRYLSGYGEKIGLALGWLVGIWILFAVLYTQVGFAHPPSPPAPAAAVYTTDEVGMPQRLNKAFGYSLGVITLQRPDPRPLTTTAWSLVLAETVLGPIQAALLILAVRRRFMR